MGWDMSNILVNLSTAGGGTDPELANRVSALEETVGDETSGVVKDVDDLQTSVSGLTTTVSNNSLYSETPTICGKWGTEDLYRVMYSVSGVTLNGSYSKDLQLAAGAVVRGWYGWMTEGNNRKPLNYYGSSSDFLSTRIESGIFKVSNSNSHINVSYDLIVEYTVTPPETETRSKKKGGK